MLGLTASLTASTLVVAFVAGLMPRLVGDEPNPVMGIRTKATMSNPEAWRLAHQIAWPLLRRAVWVAVAGVCLQVVIGVVTGFGSVVSAVASVAVFLAVLIVLLYAAVKGDAAAKSLRR